MILRNKKFFLFPVISIILACANAITVYAQSHEPLKIGVVLSLSGPAAYWSEYQRKGIELAVDQAKQQGTAVELYIEDAKTENVSAVTAVRMLASLRHVDVLIGDTFSFITDAMAPAAEQVKVPLITPSMETTECTNAHNPFLFTVSSQIPDATQAFDAIFSNFSNHGSHTAALVTLDDAGWGGVYRTMWLALAKKYNVSVTSDVVVTEFAPDFKPILLPIVAKKPDMIFFAHEPLSGLKVLKQLAYKGKFISANALLEILARRDKTGDIAEGAVTANPIVTKEFTDAFTNKFGHPPLLEAQAGYEATRSAIAAWKELGSKSFVDALRAVHYTGVAGNIDLSQQCMGTQGIWKPYVVKNQVLTDLRP